MEVSGNLDLRPPWQRRTTTRRTEYGPEGANVLAHAQGAMRAPAILLICCYVALVPLATAREKTSNKPKSPPASSQTAPDEAVVSGHVNQGVAQYRSGDMDGAIASFSAAIRVAPRMAALYFNRANAYMHKPNFTAALSDANKAIELKIGKLEDAYVLRGSAHAGLGQYDAAIADCNRALQINPKHPLAYNNRANDKLRKGDYAGALADCNRALALDANLASAYYNRGHTYAATRNPGAAVSDWTTAVRLEPRLANELNPKIAQLQALGAQPAIAPPPVSSTAATAPTAAADNRTDLLAAAQKLIGAWQGGRHRTRYDADGTFVTDPHLVPNAPRGQWKVEGERLVQTFPQANTTMIHYILSITDKELVIRNTSGAIFRLTKLSATEAAQTADWGDKATSPPAAAAAAPEAVTFNQFKSGPAPAGLFAMLGGRIIAEKGSATIRDAGPEMVLPGGHKKVLTVDGDRTSTIRFAFDPPIAKFTLTRIGVINNASVPSWQLEALDASGNVIDVIGEIHGLYPRPRSYSVKGDGIASVRLTSDNRYGSGTWATYNSVPVAQFEIERRADALVRATPSLPPTAPAPLVAGTTATPPSLPRETPVSQPGATVTHPPTPAATATASAITTVTPPPGAATPGATPMPTAVAMLQKPASPPPAQFGKPEAVMAAVRQGGPASTGGRQEPIGNGAFIVQRPEAWELAETTEKNAIFVSSELANVGVTFDWSASADNDVLQRGSVERLDDARHAWVETAEPDRREALRVAWQIEGKEISATAIAPSAVWQKEGPKILAMLNVRKGDGTLPATPKATPTPEPEVSPTPSPPPTASPTPTPTPTPPPLTAAASVVQSGKPVPPSGALQAVSIADGKSTLQHDASWQVAESSTSYVVLTDIATPDLGVTVDWSPARGRSLDQLAQQALQKLRAMSETAQALPDRKIAGVAAKQLAWLTGSESGPRENLEVEWVARETLFRATISAPPELWQKHGPRVLRLLEDITAGGGS